MELRWAECADRSACTTMPTARSDAIEPRRQKAHQVLRELAFGFLRDLHDEHVARGSPHDLSWNGAEFVTLRRAQSAVPDHNKTPVIWARGVQKDFRWVTGLHSSRNITHAIG